MSPMSTFPNPIRTICECSYGGGSRRKARRRDSNLLQTPAIRVTFVTSIRMVSQGKSFSGYDRNPFFLNPGGNGFADVGGILGVDFEDDARAVASVDWDRDGDLDLWVTNRTAPRVRLLRNNHPSSNAFLAIRLIGNGKTTNRDAVGARLALWRSSEPQAQTDPHHSRR